MSGQPAVFLDRDGTLIEERGYPTAKDDIVLRPDAGAALARLAAAGYARIVLTNQSAIARGMLTEEELAALHADLLAKLAADGGTLDAIYYCPHHPDGTAIAYSHACQCRKPAPGMLELAVREHELDLTRSAFIGDSPRDLFPGVPGTGPRLLVHGGHPLSDVTGADHVAASLSEAVDWLLARTAQGT
ncbi:MAG: D-glycero-alpha-D-manno-heptose-1,7-bisphosphate 7-phosphatase [Planctomycetota bacterium]